LERWGISAQTVTRGGTGKHIFSHVEWHMGTMMVETEGERLPEGWVWADRGELERQYAVPNAFRAFEPTVKERLGYF
jgi:A/G-specific adenine glycosylase